MPRQKTLIGLLALAGIAVSITVLQRKRTAAPKILKWPELGEVAHPHNGVQIYSNGLEVFNSHGKHHAADGYYYGRKWQCVEFIKRYYHDAHDHQMPNVWGHAKDFYQSDLTHGSINQGRNMLQFANCHSEKPQADDLLVWNNEPYGHVAVIAEVHDDHIVVAQQNIYGAPLEELKLTLENGQWTIIDDTKPAGWLRLVK